LVVIILVAIFLPFSIISVVCISFPIICVCIYICICIGVRIVYILHLLIAVIF
jgi:hypothetical protein